MVLIFYGFMTILLIINTLSKRKNEDFLFFLGIGTIWFLSVFVNEDYVDWQAYQAIFERSNCLYYTKDIGFGILCYFLNSLGFTAISLRIVIFSIGYFLIYVSLKKLKVNKLLFLMFYSYYPVASDAMHLRTCIVSYILIYAVIAYINDKNWIKYISLIILAALFHKMAVFYLPIVLINRIRENNKYTKRFLMGVGILVIVVGSNRSFTNYVSNFLVGISESVELGNITNSVGSGIENGWIIDWIIQLLFLLFLFYIKQYFEKKYPKEHHPTNAIFWVNVIALLFLPFYFISFDYFRMFRNMLAINYMSICLYIQDFYSVGIRIISFKKVLALIISIALVLLTGYMKVGYRGREKEEFYNYFYNNHISIVKYEENNDE